MSEKGAPEAAADRILNLWPTLLGQCEIADAEVHLPALRALAERETLPSDLLTLAEPCTRWLNTRLLEAAHGWLAGAEADAGVGLRVEARLERIEMCESRPLANEPGAFLAGVLFLERPAPSDIQQIRSDCVPSQVTLYDPRPGFNAISLEGDPYFAPTVNVDAVPGALALWPASVRRFVSVHLARTPWLLISVRVLLDPSVPSPSAETVRAMPLRMAKIFATKVIRRHFPDFRTRTKELKSLIVKDERQLVEATERYQSQDLFARSERPVAWLRQHIDETVEAYLAHIGVRYPVTWAIEGWYNVNHQGDHHAPHGHQGSYLSGTYYVDVPLEPSLAAAHSACISFYDPRAAANMAVGGVGPDAEPSFTVEPKAGTMLMWPSPLFHYVHPNRSGRPRMSISFNIVLKSVGYTRL